MSSSAGNAFHFQRGKSLNSTKPLLFDSISTGAVGMKTEWINRYVGQMSYVWSKVSEVHQNLDGVLN